MFTGTLIEELFATVERVEAAQPDETLVDSEAWLASAQGSADYDSNLVAVA